MSVIRRSSASRREKRSFTGLVGRGGSGKPGRKTPTRPTRPAWPTRLAGIRVHEEENQRDEQHVNHERFDQDESENQVAANLARRARIAGNALHRGSNRARLSQRAERGGNREREAGRDYRPPDNLRV